MNIIESEPIEFPEKKGSDAALDALIEIAANPISVAAKAIVGSFREDIKARQNEFFHRVAAKLNEHEKRLADLEVSPRVVSATYQMWDAFMRTHAEDEKKAIVNAAANMLLNPPETELEQNQFLEFIGLPSFNVYHVRLLRLLCCADEDFARAHSVCGLIHRIENCQVENGLNVSRDIIDRVWKDLSDRGFVVARSLSLTMTGASVAEKQTTDLGDRFLAFIDE